VFNRYTSLTQQSVDTIQTLETPSVTNRLFTIVTDNRIHQSISFLGTAIVVFVIYSWCIHTYKSLENGGTRPKAKEFLSVLLLTLFIVVNIQNFTSTSKNTVKNFDVPSNKTVKGKGLRPQMIQATHDELNQSDLSAQYILNSPRIKRIINQYKISF
jgi:hypothetical protein